MSKSKSWDLQRNQGLSIEEKLQITRKRIYEIVDMECRSNIPVVFIDNDHEFAETKAGD